MRASQRRRPQLENLEERALLSGARAAVRHGQAAQALVSTRQTSTESPPPVTPPAVGDVQALQVLSSGNQLKLMLAQVAALTDTRPEVQQFAQMSIATSEMTSAQLFSLGQSAHVILPAVIQGTDQQQAARQVLTTVNTPAFDQTYLSTLVQIDTQAITQGQALANTTQDPQIKQFAQGLVTSEQSSLMMAQALLASATTSPGGQPGGGFTLGGPMSMNLPANEVMILQDAYSSGQSHLLLSQIAALESNDPNLQLYAQKLVNDHYLGNLMIQQVASATGTMLQPAIFGADQQSVRQVLGALNSGNFTQAYLQDMVQSHQADLTQNQQAVGNIQNPNLKALIQSEIPTDYLHLVGAQTLLNGNNNGGGNNGGGNVTVGHQNFRPNRNGLTYGEQVFAGRQRFTSHYTLRAQNLGNGNGNQGAGLTNDDAAFLFANELLAQAGFQAPPTLPAGVSVVQNRLQSRGNRVNFVYIFDANGVRYNNNYTLQASGPRNGQLTSPDAASIFADDLIAQLNPTNFPIQPGGQTGNPIGQTGNPTGQTGNQVALPGGPNANVENAALRNWLAQHPDPNFLIRSHWLKDFPGFANPGFPNS